MTTIGTRLTIDSLTAASVDIGDSGHPGTGASKIECDIIARRDGRWEAEGSVSDGCNQGYYQENYSYGPWRGRGDTPQDAVKDMVERADDNYQDDMRRAGHDALLECDDATFASLAAAEADRIEGVLSSGEPEGSRYAKIGPRKYYVDANQRTNLRRRAVNVLRRIAANNTSPLASVSDDDLMAEVERRGLTS